MDVRNTLTWLLMLTGAMLLTATVASAGPPGGTPSHAAPADPGPPGHAGTTGPPGSDPGGSPGHAAATTSPAGSATDDGADEDGQADGDGPEPSDPATSETGTATEQPAPSDARMTLDEDETTTETTEALASSATSQQTASDRSTTHEASTPERTVPAQDDAVAASTPTPEGTSPNDDAPAIDLEEDLMRASLPAFGGDTAAPDPTPGASNLGTSGSSLAPTATELAASWLVPGIAIGALGAIFTLKLRGRDATEPDDEPDRTGAGSDPSTADAAPEPSSPTVPQAPVAGIDGLLLLGQDALDRGDLDQAVGWFETAIAIKPDLQAAHFCMGLCLDELDRLEEAEEALSNACDLQPGDPLAAYQHAGVLARLGRSEAALEHVARLTQRLPDVAERLADDGDFACLMDHPRFLALIGEL